MAVGESGCPGSPRLSAALFQLLSTEISLGVRWVPGRWGEPGWGVPPWGEVCRLRGTPALLLAVGAGAEGAPAAAGEGSQGLPVPPRAEGAVALASSCPGLFPLPPVSLDGTCPRCRGSSRVCCGAGEQGCGGQQVRRPHSSPSLLLVFFPPRLHARGCREGARSRRAVGGPGAPAVGAAAVPAGLHGGLLS